MPTSSATSPAWQRLNRAWYLGTFAICLAIGAGTVGAMALASRSRTSDTTLSVPSDELALGIVALLLWLAVLSAIAWWALRTYRSLSRPSLDRAKSAP